MQKSWFLSFSLLAILGVIFFPPFAHGQWTTQTITLSPGWNAVFLEVQPEPNDCNTVFQDIAIESVWMWNRRFSSVQFIQDATTLIPDQPEWLKFIPDTTIVNNLYTVQGGRAYLIKLGGAVPVDWSVKGRPVMRAIDWMGDSFNLVGFNVDSSALPTFEDFFASSPAHAGNPVYKLSASGQWQSINLAFENIEHGRAYWVFCEGQSQFTGPVNLSVEQGGEINFGRVLNEQTIRIKNASKLSMQITISKLPSETPPVNSLPPLAGEVPLSYWDSNALNWMDISSPLQLNLLAGEEAGVRIAVRRKDMTATSADALYQNLLEVVNGFGSRLLVPVLARGLSSQSASTQSLAAKGFSPNADETTHQRAGLWVGTAVINKVNFPADLTNPLVPRSTASEFQMRIIVHVDASGQASLLKEVTLMWQDGTTRPDPTDPSKFIVDQPGRFVLVTDEDLLAQLSGSAIRDGEQVGRRISTAAFAFSEPQPMVAVTGDFGEGGGVVECVNITLDYDDNVNPFKHKYHPDHDNLGYDYATVHPEGRESYSIERDIRLEFSSTDPELLTLSGWGDNQIGGIYREWISGVYKSELAVEGIFRLYHVSRLPVLNDYTPQ
jgi:hypothetical protein